MARHSLSRPRSRRTKIDEVGFEAYHRDNNILLPSTEYTIDRARDSISVEERRLMDS